MYDTLLNIEADGCRHRTAERGGGGSVGRYRWIVPGKFDLDLDKLSGGRLNVQGGDVDIVNISRGDP